MTYKTIFLFACLFAISCSKDVQQSEIPLEEFFDLEEFIDKELEKQVIIPVVTRNIILDDVVESTKIQDFDMQENLLYLKKFNINQPRWYDKYNIEKEANSILYTAKDSSLRVEKFKYGFLDDQVEYVDVTYKTGTFISSTRKKIHWEPSKRLNIDNRNKSLWTDPSRLQIEWLFEEEEI